MDTSKREVGNDVGADFEDGNVLNTSESAGEDSIQESRMNPEGRTIKMARLDVSDSREESQDDDITTTDASKSEVDSVTDVDFEGGDGDGTKHSAASKELFQEAENPEGRANKMARRNFSDPRNESEDHDITTMDASESEPEGNNNVDFEDENALETKDSAGEDSFQEAPSSEGPSNKMARLDFSDAKKESEDDDDEVGGAGNVATGFAIDDCEIVGYNQQKKELVRCKICGEVVLKKSFWRHRGFHKKPFKCKLCSYRTSSESRLENHRTEQHSSDYSLCTVPGCKEEFSYRNEYQRHIQQFHNMLPDQLSCEFCGKFFRDTNALNIHSLSHVDDRQHKCSECGSSYKTLSSLRMHIKSHLPYEQRPYKCPSCPQRFTRKDKMEKHKTSHIDEPISAWEEYKKCPHIQASRSPIVSLKRCEDCGIICEGCAAVFSKRRLSRQHTHHNFCLECGRKSLKATAHKLHTYYHVVRSELQCQPCQYGFIDLKHLDLHNNRTHKIVWPKRKMEVEINNPSINWVCRACNKTYATEQCLRIHKKLHQEKSFKCHVSSCGKEFITKTLLDHHISRHINDKPHTCSSCGKGFVRKTDLYRHERTQHTHNDDDNVECPLCDMELKSNRNLQLHLKSHQAKADKGEDFKCDCGKAFLRKTHFKTHQQVVHQTDFQPADEPPKAAPKVRLTRKTTKSVALHARIKTTELNDPIAHDEDSSSDKHENEQEAPEQPSSSKATCSSQ